MQLRVVVIGAWLCRTYQGGLGWGVLKKVGLFPNVFGQFAGCDYEEGGEYEEDEVGHAPMSLFLKVVLPVGPVGH